MEKQKLIDMALDRIIEDVWDGDLTAIEELLGFTPDENLVGYIADDELDKKFKESQK